MFFVFKYTDQLQTYPTDPFYKKIKPFLVEIFHNLIHHSSDIYLLWILPNSQNRKGRGHFYLTILIFHYYVSNNTNNLYFEILI